MTALAGNAALAAQLTAVTAERDRYRAALERIAAGARGVADCAAIARRALAGQPWPSAAESEAQLADAHAAFTTGVAQRLRLRESAAAQSPEEDS